MQSFEDQLKREGSNIHQLNAETENQFTDMCVWGVQKFYGEKQCLRFFRKHFHENEEVTHLCKLKNKTYFLVRLKGKLSIQNYNQTHASGKKVKVKNILSNMQMDTEYFKNVKDIMKHQQNHIKQPLQEQLMTVQNMKIEDVVTPLHRLPYLEQIQVKKKNLEKVIQNYNRAFFKDGEVTKLISEGTKIQQLRLNNFINCQNGLQGYRSKCQFTFGMDKHRAIVGYNKGNYYNRTIMVQTPKNVIIISKKIKLVLALVEEFVNENLEILSIFNRYTQQGFWRYLIVRDSQRTQQTMIIFVAKTKDVQDQVLKDIKTKLVSYFKHAIVGLKSLCFLSYNGQSDSVPNQKPQLLFGSPYYQEQILGHIYQVSPSAFLQVHIEMCEVLYKQVIQFVQNCDLILDLGCGIGSIGISIQKYLPQIHVIGIQCCQEAVQDAKMNEPSYEVIFGRAEDHIKSICQKHKGKRIIAVLDPPRAGFNKEVLLSLRKCKGLDNIIYIACNAGAIQDNLLQLTLPPTVRRKAPHFIIKNMIGMDLFPHTLHYEVIYNLQRKY